MTANDHWAVTVSRNGERIVTIESNCLSGREITAADEQTIRTAANHLLSFIGDPYQPIPPCERHCSVCDGSDHHWMEDFTDDGEPIWSCKHCDLTKPYLGLDGELDARMGDEQ